jgi:SWIM zinc finger
MSSRARVGVRPMIIKVHDEEAWYVQSESNAEVMYKTTLHSCECKAYQYRGGTCKHIERVIEFLVNDIRDILDGDDNDLLVKLLEESIRIIQEQKRKKAMLEKLKEKEQEFEP